MTDSRRSMMQRVVESAETMPHHSPTIVAKLLKESLIENADLRAENAGLRAENAELRRVIEDLRTPAGAAPERE